MATRLLEDKLTCSICLGLYQDPVTLPCGHNYCGACIRDWCGGCEKACPECREPFRDGAELRRNVALNGVLEVVRAASPDRGPSPDPSACCPQHRRPLELFCRTEGRCVCSACTMSECRLHEWVLLDAERREREVTGGGRGGPPPCSPLRGQLRREAALGCSHSKMKRSDGQKQVFQMEIPELGTGQGEVRGEFIRRSEAKGSAGATNTRQ